jgi:hypothetical protein
MDTLTLIVETLGLLVALWAMARETSLFKKAIAVSR